MLPPEPKMAKMAQSIEWASRPYGFLERCAAEIGDRFTIDLGTYGAFVIVSAPDDVRDVFRADPRVLHAGEGNAVLRRFLGDHSLLLLEEDAHLAERRLLMPAFTPARVRAHVASIERATREAFATVPTSIGELRDAAEQLSLGVILEVVLGDAGDAIGDLAARIRALLDDPRFNLALLHQLSDAEPSPALRSLIDDFAAIRARVIAIVEARRARRETARGDVLGIWLDARSETGEELSDVAIAEGVLTLVVTGYETTATALSWASVLLTRAPHVSAELARIAQASPQPALDPYLDAVCREVLRFHPVIPIVGRRVCAPFRLGDLELPVGATIAPSIHLAHRRVATWGDPDVFRPARFLEREPTPYEYFPFGGGSRRCLGLQLAMLELKVAIAWCAARGGFVLGDVDRIRPRRRSVTIAPAASPGPREGERA